MNTTTNRRRLTIPAPLGQTSTSSRYATYLLGGFALLAAACGGGGGGGGGGSDDDPPMEDFDRRSLLASYTQRVALPALRDFVTDATALENATGAFEAAIEGGSTADTERATARDAWRTAMETWQLVEVMQVGPAGSSTMTMGGQGLRDQIYSRPTVNPCRVDQETVSGDFLDNGFFDEELVNARGLDAIEYLLFDADETNACDAAVDINANGSWQALVDSGDLAERRAAYAARAAADVTGRAVQLRDAWEPTGGNFAGQLSQAGLSGSPYATAHDAVNEVFAALFYVELDVKDQKLAAPAGISPECNNATCPELRESRWANVSKENVLSNLAAVEQTFLGGDASGIGFDDFLDALGAAELADTMLADLRNAITVAQAIPGTLNSALAEDPDSVRDAHATLKAFTDNLKSQFVTVLNLEVPREGAGDND